MSRAQLPGIVMERVAAPRAPEMPRMDIAVFCGFAERGPSHVAIVVESVAAYQAAFGGDAPLAWDALAGRTATANLAQTVRSFFSNGGTRCWIVRLCETEALAALRASVGGESLSPARAGRFRLPGLLSVEPDAGGTGAATTPAMVEAASPGSWSDALRLSARVERMPLAVEVLSAVPDGVRIADAGVLAVGDLVELTGAQHTNFTYYMKVVRREAGGLLGCWIAGFVGLELALPEVAGTVDLAEGPVAATSLCTAGAEWSVLVEASADALPQEGQWLRFTRDGERHWLRVAEARDGTIRGSGWREVPCEIPAGTVAAHRVTVTMAQANGGAMRRLPALGLTPEARDSLHGFTPDDVHYADEAVRRAGERPLFAFPDADRQRIATATGEAGGFSAAAARFGTAPLTAADRIALCPAFLPLGLDGQFGPEVGPLPDTAEPLERDGLAAFDARIFLDPRLAEASAHMLAERAAAIRSGGEAPLMGIHAALDIQGELFPEASIIAVPDMAQAPWESHAAPDPVPPVILPDPARPEWVTHRGGCAPADSPETLTEPDRSRFLDAATRRLDPPLLRGPALPVRDGIVALRWIRQADDAIILIEEASRPDFADAAEVLREAGPVALTLTGRTEGAYYYRLRIEQDGNVSGWSVLAVSVRFSRYRTLAPDTAVLRRLHLALARLAGGSGDLFALLSMPVSFRADAARSHAATLVQRAPGAGDAARLGWDEQRLLSYCALYHPWLESRQGKGPERCSPEGAVAGIMAARARARGAWIAPANEPIADAIGLAPLIGESDLLPLDTAAINMVRRLPRDLAVLDADSLSDEDGWRPLNVRRLMQLLRRMALRLGQTLVFEPNGPVVRRAMERRLTEMLDGMQTRGAFAGARSDLSWRLAIRDSEGDRMNGQLVAEIAVAPSWPMRFLTVRLVQQGARLSMVENG